MDTRFYSALRRAVACANGKGGVCKTSITTTLATSVAARGRRVLLVDLDPQGNTAHDLGYPFDANGGGELFDAVARGRSLVPSHRDVRPGLDVIAGGHETRVLSTWLSQQPSSQARYGVAAAIATIAAEYDLVLIDCPPGEQALQEAALITARWLVIPTNADASSRAGLHTMADRFETARESNPYLDLAGIVLTLVPTAASAIREQARTEIVDAFGSDEYLCTASIRHAVRAAIQVRQVGRTPNELTESYAAGLAADYAALTDELLSRMVARQQEEAR